MDHVCAMDDKGSLKALVRAMSLAELNLSGSHSHPPSSIVASLPDQQQHSVLLACVLVFLLSSGNVVHWVFQLQVVLRPLEGDGIMHLELAQSKYL
jgi:proteasome lid subunit RPN8/RPN11